LFSLSAILVVVVVISAVPKLQGRFQNVVDALRTENIDKTTTESTAVRMLIWKEARNIVRDHPAFGISPGDSNDELYERYKMAGLTGAYAKKLNAHSQYYQTAVGLGLIGLISLIVVLFSPLFSGRDRLMVFFLLICAVNFLTESMLQTMAGSIFFGYFYGMLAVRKSEAEI
jgi:O-antigen ligase